MLTPRTTLARRVTAALDASPSRIPVLLGGCGSGRTTLLQQLRERIGRTSAQYIDVERTATTPERFLRAVTAVSVFPVTGSSSADAGGARVAFDATIGLFGAVRKRRRAGPRRFCSTSSSSCGRSKAFQACGACCTTSPMGSR